MSKKKKNYNKNSRYLRRRKTSPLKIAFWLILALLSGFVIYNMYRFIFDRSYNIEFPPSNKTDTVISETTPVQKTAEKEPETKEKESDDGKNLKQNEGEDPNSLDSLTGSVASANKNGENLSIRINIDQYLSNGTCTLHLENGSKTIKRSASIIPTASTSSCEGFDVPLSELYSGNWGIIIELSSDEKTGEIKGDVSI